MPGIRGDCHQPIGGCDSSDGGKHASSAGRNQTITEQCVNRKQLCTLPLSFLRRHRMDSLVDNLRFYILYAIYACTMLGGGGSSYLPLYGDNSFDISAGDKLGKQERMTILTPGVSACLVLWKYKSFSHFSILLHISNVGTIFTLITCLVGTIQ